MVLRSRLHGWLAVVARIRSRSAWHFRIVLSAALLAAIGLGVMPVRSAGGMPPPSPVQQAINKATKPYVFDLVGWELTALAEGATRRAQAALMLPALGETEQRDVVLRYYKAAAEASRISGQLDAAYLPIAAGRDSAQITDLKQRLASADRQRDELAPMATEILAGQIQTYVAAEGIADAPLQPVWRVGFPPLTFTVTPPVFFRFSDLPLLLVVAPRDKIEVIQSTFLQPTLSVNEMEGVEAQIDRQGVASLVVAIGGFAAYPSMVPSSTSLRDTSQVVAHEWVHQYLAMRPLGRQYLGSYALRSINETVADLAGKEIGEAVYRRYYESGASRPPGLAAPEGSAQPEPPALDFGQAMVEIRQTVEAMLARGDVAGAEQYMAERKQWLATQGYYLRKLNTAYLTFYGAYAGAGNPYEPKLRRLRERAGSLSAFLREVAAVESEQDFEALTRD